jgi:hypothetical protein
MKNTNYEAPRYAAFSTLPSISEELLERKLAAAILSSNF